MFDSSDYSSSGGTKNVDETDLFYPYCDEDHLQELMLQPVTVLQTVNFA